ncbi:MAG: prolipoprotein diacylglyceryl transferase [Clostridiales bacterium]|jgi:phosphatidylglycerol:prolipoprotein diacylglycerol transferase|nr:prolipoprotein diacylglyceryl transferase [Clostridiales bacterium]MDR2752647.1 prolipoprotein diacylglyceryl transferase [Clostridiales bacterium]
MQAPEVTFPNLGIEIAKLPKEAFSIGTFSIYWYSIFIILGVIAGATVAVIEARRIGHKPDVYTDFLFYVLITSILGARIYYVIFTWDAYKDNLIKILAFREGGLAIYGGVIAAFLTAVVYAKIKKLNYWAFVDVAAPGLVMGQAVGRWGNFFNREVFGHYSESLFAMRYLASTVSVIPASVAERMVVADGAEYIQVQPAFLYESAWNLLVFFFLCLWQRKRKVEGEVALMYMVCYGIGRFIIEGIRTDQLFFFGTDVPVSQALSAILVVCAGAAIIVRRLLAKRKGQTAPRIQLEA